MTKRVYPIIVDVHMGPICRNKNRRLSALKLTTIPSKQYINCLFFFLNVTQAWVIFL